MRYIVGTIGLLLGLATPLASALAQDLFIYPAKGQSQAQQDKDRYECHLWAVQQTGFDPSKASTAYAQPAQEAPQGGVLRGAARGATVGVVGGAIGGNAGKGAAIGAATGALIGGMRRNDQVRQQEYQSQQQASAVAAQQGSYNRALAACLQGRGYTIN
jgi:hypothetical protein